MTVATLPPATRSSSTNSRPRHRRSATLPTRLPSIAPQSTLIAPVISNLNPVTRINVLHPPTVPRRTVFFETSESQHHMQRRCLLMRQQQWMREHGEWQKPMYGTAAVKEDYRSQIRSTLKTQMEERDRGKRREWNSAFRESIAVAAQDMRDCQMDVEKRRDKLNFLVTFTKANKEMMESRWKERRLQKILEDKKDLEQLKYNPINWSHTLK
ncbi:uncharacterized protein LOC143460935 [Clavelina lepadiformis]|uniref:Uncharacterized protein n=1 Tax=Clavelina lepadiformis TaxID=159417 RepID=A0ABP0GBB7_CLALP